MTVLCHPQFPALILQSPDVVVLNLLTNVGCPYCRPDYTQHEKDEVRMDIMREITSLWQTDELRRHKPTPVDGKFPMPG